MAWNKMQSGDALRIHAADWNAIGEHLEAPQRGDLARLSRASNPRTYVSVHNAGTVVIPAGTLVMLGDPLISPADNLAEYLASPVYAAKVPYRDKEQPLAVTLAPINPDGQGVAVVSGMVPVLCNVGDVGDTRIRPDGSGGAVTAEDGPLQLVHAPGKGVQWCQALLGGGGVAVAATKGKRGPFGLLIGSRQADGTEGTTPAPANQQDGEAKDEPVVICRNTSLPADTTEAGYVYLGNAHILVNAMETAPAEGQVYLDVQAVAAVGEDGQVRHTLTAEVALAAALPQAQPDERRYILRLGTVVRQGEQWQVAAAREPGDVEILGRWC